MYVISFCFDSKLVLEKAEKPASYELARHTVFSKYFTYFFKKRVLDIFKWTFWQTSFHQVLYNNKAVYFLEALYQVKHPC